MSITQNLVYKADLSTGTPIVNLSQPLVVGDQDAHKFVVTLTDKGYKPSLDNTTCRAYFVRKKQGVYEAETIILPGTVNDDSVSVTLNASCYSRSAYFSLFVKLSDNATGEIRTILIVRGTVITSQDGNVLDPEDVVMTLDELLAQIAAMEQATAEAREATVAANQAAENVEAFKGEIQGDITALTQEISSIATIKKWNLLDGCKIKEGWFGGTDGVGFAHSGYFTVEDVPVQAGTAIVLYASSGYYKSARAASFFDASGAVVGYVEENADLATVGCTVPAGAVKASVTIGYVNGTTEKPNEYYVCLRGSVRVDRVEINKDVIIPGMRASIGIRKPTLSFIFDDANASDSEIVSIFDDYGYKCGFAILSTTENIDDYLTYQAMGYEILSHSTDGNIMDLSVTDISSIAAKLKTSKDVLMSKGFDIRGWVTPSTDFNNNAFPALCKYYEYGFGHLHKDGHARNYVHTLFSEDVRQLDRYGIEGSNVDETKSFIDSVIAANGYGCFYAHALSTSNNFTRENLTVILDYIKAKVDAGELVVDIPRNAIRDYYMLRQYDFPLTNP